MLKPYVALLTPGLSPSVEVMLAAVEGIEPVNSDNAIDFGNIKNGE